MASQDSSTPAVVAADVRVYNKSPQRSYIHDKYVLAPNSFLTVSAPVAKIWLEGYPDTIVEAGVAQKELGGLTSELAAAKARIAELEAAAEKKKPSKKTDEVV